MSEKGVFKSIIECRCPECRTGKMFSNPAYKLAKFGAMPVDCPQCGYRFEREPGYFFGAMYVSYALSVGIFLTTVVTLLLVLGDPSLQTYIITVGVVSLLLYPFTFRYSRVIFVYAFSGAKYDPKKGLEKVR